jgi:hypothetical protein
MQYGYRVVYGDQDLLTKAGYEKVAHLPCLFDMRPGYHRLGSRFLIDRGLGVWDPVNRGKIQAAIPPSTWSMKSFADRLANFLEWCEIRAKSPLTAEYQRDLVGQYQLEMQKGIWARDAVRLSPRTINSRIDIACEYLLWLTDKGLREPFFIPKSTRRIKTHSATSSVGHLPKEVAMRSGKVRQSKRRLQFPLEETVREWLRRIYDKHGLARGLMAETIIETAVRREEISCWRLETLPRDRNDWDIPNREAPYASQTVLVTIIYGVKGKEYGRDHGDKIGPEGIIRVPLPLADKLHDYRMKGRPQALRKWVKGGKTLKEQRLRQENAVYLFLDQDTGQRITAQSLYDTWRSVERPKGWSPHLARDYWACMTMWRGLQRHDALVKLLQASQLEEIPMSLLASTAESILQLEIQPQLRHADPQTSLIYLQWLADRLGTNMNINYEKDLDNSLSH